MNVSKQYPTGPWTVEWPDGTDYEKAEQWCKDNFEPDAWSLINKPIVCWEIVPIKFPTFVFSKPEYAIMFVLKWRQ